MPEIVLSFLKMESSANGSSAEEPSVAMSQFTFRSYTVFTISNIGKLFVCFPTARHYTF